MSHQICSYINNITHNTITNQQDVNVNVNVNIEQLLQSGFETIVQAFELKSTTLQTTINEQNDIIKEYQNKINILKEEINLLSKENSFYKTENNKLKHIQRSIKSRSTHKEDTITNNSKHTLIKETPDLHLQNINTNINTINSNQKCLSLTDRTERFDHCTNNTPLYSTPLNVNKHRHHYSSSNILHSNIEQPKTHYCIHKQHLTQREHDYHSHSSSNNEYEQMYYKDEYNVTSSSNNINNTLHNNNTLLINKHIHSIEQFLNECKSTLPSRTFNKVIYIFQEFKDGLLDDNTLLCKIHSTLHKYNHLINTFNDLFYS
jgi:hypothetical protein